MHKWLYPIGDDVLLDVVLRGRLGVGNVNANRQRVWIAHLTQGKTDLPQVGGSGLTIERILRSADVLVRDTPFFLSTWTGRRVYRSICQQVARRA